MSRVEEIEAAINELQPEEYRRILEWFRAREQERWDEQMRVDAQSGKLDFLYDEAKKEAAHGLLRECGGPILSIPLCSTNG
jgi:hypothetical protein